MIVVTRRHEPRQSVNTTAAIVNVNTINKRSMLVGGAL